MIVAVRLEGVTCPFSRAPERLAPCLLGGIGLRSQSSPRAGRLPRLEHMLLPLPVSPSLGLHRQAGDSPASSHSHYLVARYLVLALCIRNRLGAEGPAIPGPGDSSAFLSVLVRARVLWMRGSLVFLLQILLGSSC